ncbi:GMC family oxidoreductase [Salininema proteolyticum]|uniref:GMC family oxidoreductase n=1 Tax=Salininema proteolyticum TaxID=1607685 RepID=A0ABV8TUS2_9ACTN
MEIGRRTLLGSAGIAGLAALDLPIIGDDDEDEAPGEVDFVVIGSGPGGVPLATRLVEAGFTVLVLEAGPPEGDRTLYEVPALHHRIGAGDEQVRWDFYVRHYTDEKLNEASSQWVPEQQGVLYPRASTLGGCTAHNAMVTMCPEPSDWEHVRELTGDADWGAEPMWERWERLRSWQPMEYYALNELTPLDPQVGAIVDATLEEVSALPGGGVTDQWRGLNDRANVYEHNQGFYPPELSTENARRWSMRERLEAVRDEHPDRLFVATDALAEKIVLEGSDRPKAVGVQFLKGRHLYSASPLYESLREGAREEARRTVRARREVIVSAGAYNSPQLLMLSGIGPGDHLSAFGIRTAVDLPGVGANLQDRYEIPVVTDHPDFMLLAGCTFGEGLVDPCLAQWKAMQATPAGGVSFYGTNGALAGIKRRIGEDPRAQVYAFGLPADFRGYRPGYDDGYVHDKFTWLILKGYTESRGGTVRLRSADPSHSPSVVHRKFDDGKGGEADLDAMVECVEMVRRVNERAGVGTEVWPGPEVEGERLRDWILKESWGHHASCTNPIGPDGDGGAVLDAKFRVRGVDGLRVVDASSFPRIPGLFIWAPIAMISEKAGDDLLAEHA